MAQMYFLSRRPSTLFTGASSFPYALAAGLWVWTLGRLSLLPALFWTVIAAGMATLLTVAWMTQKALTQRFARFADGRPCWNHCPS